MKKKYLLSLMLVSLFAVGCEKKSEKGEYEMENVVNQVPLYAGNIMDTTDQNKERIYKVKVMVSDEYVSKCENAENVIIYDDQGKILKESNNAKISLKKGKNYYIKIQTSQELQNFSYELHPLNNKVVTPYEINTSTDVSSFDTSMPDSNPLEAATIKYEQRKGGTYLYSNVPESMPDDVLDTILMRKVDLTGDCFLTFEHQNHTGYDGIYMGYRISNPENHDIYVTVTNVGYQYEGSWIGEKSWMDYYGVKYDMDMDKFRTDTFEWDGKMWTAREWFDAYLAFDYNYTPKPIQPITYKIPAGKHIYVIGGTTSDSYNNINVGNTADLAIPTGRCINGNVRFTITNGTAIGDLCVYTDAKNINKQDVIVQELRKYGPQDDLGGRIGYSDIHGVIDNNPVWIFDDTHREINLPVTYKNYYAEQLKESYEPFEPVTDIKEHTVSGTAWYSHLSAQLHHKYIGTDMVEINAIYEGKNVVLSNYIANPAGNIWDFGNWMIEYHDNCTFVNRGSVERKIKFYIHNGGSIFYIAKDQDNNILKAGATLNTCTGKEVPAYEFVIPPHSSKMISFQYVLPANNSGSIEHLVKLTTNN